jgi:hypothetical protein
VIAKIIDLGLAKAVNETGSQTAISSRIHWPHARKQPTQNTAAKKRARWEGTGSDYLFGNFLQLPAFRSRVSVGVPRLEAIDALLILRTTTVNPTVEPPSPNDDRTVVIGMTDFVSLCFADETDRPASSASVQGTTAFNLLTPPQFRLLLVGRTFDFRPLLASFPDGELERIVALTSQGDRLFSEKS